MRGHCRTARDRTGSATTIPARMRARCSWWSATPDLPTHERAMKGMSQDTDWQKVAARIEEIAPLQEMSVTVITEEQ